RTTRIARTTRTVTTRPRRTRSTARKPWAPERVRSAVPASGWPSVALRAQSSVARSARPAARWPAKRPKVTTRPARRRAAWPAVSPARRPVAQSPDLRVRSLVAPSVRAPVPVPVIRPKRGSRRTATGRAPRIRAATDLRDSDPAAGPVADEGPRPYHVRRGRRDRTHSHRPGRAADRACSARGLRRHGAGGVRARQGARPAGTPRHDLRV